MPSPRRSIARRHVEEALGAKKEPGRRLVDATYQLQGRAQRVLFRPRGEGEVLRAALGVEARGDGDGLEHSVDFPLPFSPMKNVTCGWNSSVEVANRRHRERVLRRVGDELPAQLHGAQEAGEGTQHRLLLLRCAEPSSSQQQAP